MTPHHSAPLAARNRDLHPSLVLGTMLSVVALAAARRFANYVPSISPACAQQATNVLFTATITNHSSTISSWGRPIHSSSTDRFLVNGTRSGSFSTPVASGGKTWKAMR